MKKNLFAVVLLAGAVSMATGQTSGKVGVNKATPTETFNVKGTVRITELPINGASASIYTKTDGTASAAKDQTLAATRTVVVDEISGM